MEPLLTRITSFFAIWFNDIKKHVFKVEVVNDKNKDLSLLEKRLSAVTSGLDLVAKQLEKSHNGKSIEHLALLTGRIDNLLSLLKNTKELNISRLESAVEDLVRTVKRTEVTGTVAVSNYPKVQTVVGQVDVDFEKVVKGLQVVVDSINDLKRELSFEVKGMGTVVAGSAGSRGSLKITDGTDNATLTTVGNSIALDVNVVQTVGGGTGGAGDASAANQDEQTALLTTIDTDTSNISTKIDTIAGAVAGTEMQVDVLTMPTTTVQATNLDIRDLTSASDSVAAVQSGTWNITNVSGTVSLPTGASTLAEQQSQTTHLATIAGDTTDIETAVELIDDAISTIASAVPTKAMAVSGTDGTNARMLKTDTNGELQVDVLTMPTVAVTQSGTWDEVGINDSGNSITIDINGSAVSTSNPIPIQPPASGMHVIGDGTDAIDVLAAGADDVANTNNQLVTAAMNYAYDGTTWDRVPGNATDGMLVNLGANNDVTVTGSLTSAGNVTNAGTFAVQVDGNALTSLQLADDVVYVDDADWTADTSKHTLVGGVTQTAPTANTDGDTTPLITDNLRQLRVAALESDLATAGTAHVKKYYTNAGAATDGIIWSPAAGKRWFLTHLSINVSAACTVTIEDDLAAGDSPVYKAEFAANSGVVLTFPEVPMFSGEDAADLLITTTAGNVYVTAVGYEI